MLNQNLIKSKLFEPLSDIDNYPIDVIHSPYRYNDQMAGSTNVNDLRDVNLNTGNYIIVRV